MAVFTFGKLRDITIKGNYLPGSFSSALAVPVKIAGVLASGEDPVEYGEIVKYVVGSTSDRAVTVSHVDGTETSATLFAVVLRTTDGGISVDANSIAGPRKGNTISLYPLQADGQYFEIPIILPSNLTITVGSKVYANVALSSAYGTATNVSTDNIELAGWQFASKSYQPNVDSSYCAIIRKKY